LPVKSHVDPAAKPTQLAEHRQRFRRRQLSRQPDEIGAELLEGGVADVAAFGLLGVITAFVGRAGAAGTGARRSPETEMCPLACSDASWSPGT